MTGPGKSPSWNGARILARWSSGTAPRNTSVSLPRLIADRMVLTTTSPDPGSGSATGRISPQPGSRSQNAWATRSSRTTRPSCWRDSRMTCCVEVCGTSTGGLTAGPPGTVKTRTLSALVHLATEARETRVIEMRASVARPALTDLPRTGLQANASATWPSVRESAHAFLLRAPGHGEIRPVALPSLDSSSSGGFAVRRA